MLALVVVTVLFAGGALFVKYKLEGLRTTVVQEVESRTGARLRVGAVAVNGLRGLRLDNAELAVTPGTGPSFQISVPATYVYLNLVDLLYGTITIDRIQVDDSAIRVDRPSDRSWIPGEGSGIPEAGRLLSAGSFRVAGKNCSLELINVVGTTRLAVSEFGLDVSRLSDSPDLAAKLSGKLPAHADQAIQVDLRFASFEDFDLRVHCDAITAEDVAVFLPASQRFVRSGSASPSLRVAGYPGQTLIVAFETPFENVTIRNQPDFIRPVNGTLTGVANYDAANHRLSLTTAEVESEQLGGRVKGTISFDAPSPELDLRLEATRLPVQEALSYLLQERPETYGTFDFRLQEPYQVSARLEGTTESPVVSFEGNAAAGRFSFVPRDASIPQGELQFGSIKLSWDSQSSIPVGSFTVVDGTLTHAASGLSARRLSGTLTVQENHVTVDPLNAEITGNPFVGSLKYDIGSGRLECSANGKLSSLEKVPMSKAFKDLSLSGSVNLRCNVVTSGSAYVIDGDLDATQAEIGSPWWFVKPPGIGAQARKVHAAIKPRQSITVTADTAVASSQASLTANLDYRKNGWHVVSVEGVSDKLDVTAVGRCLKIPYKVSGGTATGTQFAWNRAADDPDRWRMTASTTVDEFALLPEGGERPMEAEGLRAEITVTSPPDAKGTLVLNGKKGRMPALRERWFVPIERDPASQDAHPSVDRAWNYELAAASIEIPPWKGTDCTGNAYTTPTESGFSAFSAKVTGGGRIQGTYRNIRQDNAYDVALQWKDVPAGYLLEQLDYPRVLAGTTSGNISYSLDRDDPGTLKGRGSFDVRNGQFSADVIMSQLEGRLENKISALPPSLKFSRLETDIELDRDLVRTSHMELEAQGVKIAGSGSFVTHGDMDYDLSVAVSPEIAEKVPALRDNFNLQGLRLAQQDVELAFKVKGPMFNPRGELAELPPVGITLVSSALEVTSDAMRVIDIPRKLLADLLKIGGGIVGIPK